MTHKNNHARSKRKRKQLKLKNFRKRVYDKRLQKKLEAMKPKGNTIYGEAKSVAISVIDLFPNGGDGFLFDNNHHKYPNQRQKRKKWNWCPQSRKAA